MSKFSDPDHDAQHSPASGSDTDSTLLHTRTHRQRRRTFIKRLAFSLPVLGMSGGAGAYGYATLLERQQVQVEHRNITLDLGERGPRRCRVVALTDIHFDPLYEHDYLQRCVSLANAQQPDIIVLTGDFITRSSDRVDELAQVLGKLKARSGVYACLGNHDHWHEPQRIITALEQQGIRVLANAHVRVELNGSGNKNGENAGELILAGLQSVWGGRPDWSRAMRGLTGHDRILMLMHEPDYVNTLRHDPRIVLQCSGHTHGGQVRVPGWGALILPRYGRQFQAGLYTVGATKLYVNRGIGTVDEHVRFCCPPEIACLNLNNTRPSV